MIVHTIKFFQKENEFWGFFIVSTYKKKALMTKINTRNETWAEYRIRYTGSMRVKVSEALLKRYGYLPTQNASIIRSVLQDRGKQSVLQRVKDLCRCQFPRMNIEWILFRYRASHTRLSCIILDDDFYGTERVMNSRDKNIPPFWVRRRNQLRK